MVGSPKWFQGHNLYQRARAQSGTKELQFAFDLFQGLFYLVLVAFIVLQSRLSIFKQVQFPAKRSLHCIRSFSLAIKSWIWVVKSGQNLQFYKDWPLKKLLWVHKVSVRDTQVKSRLYVRERVGFPCTIIVGPRMTVKCRVKVSRSCLGKYTAILEEIL